MFFAEADFALRLRDFGSLNLELRREGRVCFGRALLVRVEIFGQGALFGVPTADFVGAQEKERSALVPRSGLR